MRALYLQEPNSPRLATGDAWSKYPEYNKIGLAFSDNPEPYEHRFHNHNGFWSKETTSYL